MPDPSPASALNHMRMRFASRFRLERAVASISMAAWTACVLAAVALAVILWLPAARIHLGSVCGAAAAVWVLFILIIGVVWVRRPDAAHVAKRADHILGLPDDLLSLEETSGESDLWHEATERQVSSKLASAHLSRVWPVRLSRHAAFSLVALLLLTCVCLYLGVSKAGAGAQERAEIAAALHERAAEAQPILEDWEEFAGYTTDPELKELFSRAGELREALENPDPMQALHKLNEMEQVVQSIEDAIAQESMADDAEALAEAFEAFPGLGRLSAAMRNRNFEGAAEEARTRERQASNAAQRGSQSFSNALSNLSKSIDTKLNSAPNAELQKLLKELANQLDLEAARASRGKALKLGKLQLAHLRKRLRKDDSDGDPCALLMVACAQKNAGSAAGGDPLGEASELPAAAATEMFTGVAGEGESEITVSSAETGVAVRVAGAREDAVSRFEELSRQAVTDESLPLAHRQAIRTYFEKIRPVVEAQNHDSIP
jgi:hypothetical protein